MIFSRIEELAYQKGYKVHESGLLLNPEGAGLCFVNDKGYVQTSIKFNGISIKVRAHRLQAYQKYGDRIYDEGIVVRHKDGNKLNNSRDNILIGTYSQNSMDRPEEERRFSSLYATSFSRKYDKKEVKNFHKKSKSYKKTMEEFGISSKGTLHFILNN